MATKRHHIIAVDLCKMAAETAGHIEKLHPGSEIIEGVSHPDTQCSHTNMKCKNCVKTAIWIDSI
jgi:hypothetical protein